jgi:hypothetical protein
MSGEPSKEVKQRLAHELERAEFTGDPMLQPCGDYWTHPAYRAYKHFVEALAHACPLPDPLPSVSRAKADLKNAERAHRAKAMHWHDGGMCGLRRVVDLYRWEVFAFRVAMAAKRKRHELEQTAGVVRRPPPRRKPRTRSL